jgi:dipeptidase
MDYGSLIYTTLQMAKTARDAIHIADRLMQTYGYASEGESFSIADQVRHIMPHHATPCHTMHNLPSVP